MISHVHTYFVALWRAHNPSQNTVPDYTLDLVVTTPLHKWSMLTPKRPIRVCVEYRAAFECQGVHNVLEYLQASTTDTI